MAEPVLHSLFNPDPQIARREILSAAEGHSSAIEESTNAVFVFRYEDVQKHLLSTKLVGVGLSFFDVMSITDGPLREWYGSLMFTNEGRPHHRLRSLVGKAFSPRSVETHREVARRLIGDRLARLKAAGAGDLKQILADAPMHVMCELLGVPDDDVDTFIDWVNALGPVFSIMTPEQIEAATEAAVGLLGYVEGLCEARENDPADDLISALIDAEHEGDKLTRKETAAMVANLLVAGHDTTSSQIGCTLLTLLRRPDVMDEVRNSAIDLPSMINETIRIEPAIGATARTVTEPVEICGKTREPGTMVLLSTMTANRDPAIWTNADEFVPHRFESTSAPKLLTFGGGPHHCLGAWLARLTLEETVSGVAALKPKLTEAADTIPWEQQLGSNPTRLPVSLH